MSCNYEHQTQKKLFLGKLRFNRKLGFSRLRVVFLCITNINSSTVNKPHVAPTIEEIPPKTAAVQIHYLQRKDFIGAITNI